MAFQNNAFQSSGFQIARFGGNVETNTGGWSSDNWVERQNEKYRAAKRDKERKEQAIIDAKLEQQNLLNKKKELLTEKTKQNARQISALEREIVLQQKEVEKLHLALLNAIAELKKRDDAIASILLIDSDPLMIIGGYSVAFH